MKISVFTPSHNPRFLHRAYGSLAAQKTEAAWEWLVVCNGGADYRNPDARVKVHRAPPWMNGRVGALKRFACEQAAGEAFLELDHDDELLPGCLQAAHEALGGAGANAFFSSATREVRADGAPVLYGREWGWEHADGCNVPFPPMPRSLCEIFYAPNHVRAWNCEAYWKAGGHDPMRSVCDDQDLLIRTYLAGAEFILHPAPLYRQHHRADNTQMLRNAEIQTTQAQVRDQYLHALVAEWCRRERLTMLDLGGAHSPAPGYTPVDKVVVPGGICHDVVRLGIPRLQDGEVGAIRCSDFLEHVPIGQVVPLMNDIHRALAPAGWLLAHTPSTDGRGAFCDPTHVSFWNQHSMRYYCEAQYQKYVPEITARFQAVRNFTHFPDEWHRREQMPYVTSDLCALKGQRQAGRVTWEEEEVRSRKA